MLAFMKITNIQQEGDVEAIWFLGESLSWKYTNLRRSKCLDHSCMKALCYTRERLAIFLPLSYFF